MSTMTDDLARLARVLNLQIPDRYDAVMAIELDIKRLLDTERLWVEACAIARTHCPVGDGESHVRQGIPRLAAEVEMLRAEVDLHHKRSSHGSLVADVKCVLSGAGDARADLYEAEQERDALRAEVERLRHESKYDTGYADATAATTTRARSASRSSVSDHCGATRAVRYSSAVIEAAEAKWGNGCTPGNRCDLGNPCPICAAESARGEKKR